MYGPYFERVAARATAETRLVEVRRARREFQERTGKFDEDEPWFEQRMTLFLEWFVLDRPGEDGLLPVESFLLEESTALTPAERAVYVEMTATQRTLLRIESWQQGRIELTDLIGGGEWSVRQEDPMVGLQKGDLLDARIVPFQGDLFLGAGLILQPRVAQATIMEMLDQAHGKGALSFALLDLLASLRLRFDRYRNVKVHQVYRLPTSWCDR